MSQVSLLQPHQRQAWMEALAQTAQHDFYHLPEYHALEAKREAGTAYLLVYSEGRHVIALPLVVRPVEAVAGLEETARGLQDATSVYGYAGPVASASASSASEPPATVREGFGRALRSLLGDFRVVAVFSRLHPLLPQPSLLLG